MTPETLLAVVIACLICIAVAVTALLFLMILRGMWKVIRTWNRSRPTDLW